ncbi:MAG: helix-turn-helix transcriptional regulator [Lachnospiraceae bacterium]|nr:helix-turn-helix transcriptional regulator [Lachnospiraceae bacterium]
METLYTRIKLLRMKYGLSQEQLAVKVGYSDKTAIAKIEAGKIDLPQSKIVAFTKALNTTTSYLMDGIDTINDEQLSTPSLSLKEQKLLDDFRNLNTQGQEYILQTMDMVKDKYKKNNGISRLENVDVG